MSTDTTIKPLRPQIGDVVLYRSRTGKYTVPAIITATADTLNPEGVKAGHVPALSSEWNVHLQVFSPGKPGKRGEAKDFVARQDAPISENVAGVYQEWDVPPAAVTLGDPVRLESNELAQVSYTESIDSASGVVRLPADVDGDDPYALVRFSAGTWAYPLEVEGHPWSAVAPKLGVVEEITSSEAGDQARIVLEQAPLAAGPTPRGIGGCPSGLVGHEVYVGDEVLVRDTGMRWKLIEKLPPAPQVVETIEKQTPGEILAICAEAKPGERWRVTLTVDEERDNAQPWLSAAVQNVEVASVDYADYVSIRPSDAVRFLLRVDHIVRIDPIDVESDDPWRPGWYQGAPEVCECHPDRWWPHTVNGEWCAGPGVSMATPSDAANHLMTHPDSPHRADDDLFVVLSSAPGPRKKDGKFLEIETRDGRSVTVPGSVDADGRYRIGPLRPAAPESEDLGGWKPYEDSRGWFLASDPTRPAYISGQGELLTLMGSQISADDLLAAARIVERIKREASDEH